MAGTPGKNKRRIFSLTSLGVMVLIIVIAANIFVWRSSHTKQSQIDALHNQISQVKQKINATPALPSDLDSRLAAAKAGLAVAQTALPTDVNPNDIIDFVIDMAGQSGVLVIPLAADGLAPQLPGQSYKELHFTATVTGTLENAMNFMTKLQRGQFPTLIITECTVTKTESTDYSRPEYSTQVTIKLGFAVYTAAPAANKDNGS